MSKSEGNFYTLRDLLLKGYKASAIRFLLISVPYGQQLNFTFEGLAAETGAVDRLALFINGSATAPTAPALNAALAAEDRTRRPAFCAALSNDLNTAEARAAIFDLVRAGNAAIDAGTLGAENVPHILEVLNRFDQVFAVLEDHDEESTRSALDWAEREGRLDQAAPEVLAQRALSDDKIRRARRRAHPGQEARNFARADADPQKVRGKGNHPRRLERRRPLEAQVGGALALPPESARVLNSRRQNLLNTRITLLRPPPSLGNADNMQNQQQRNGERRNQAHREHRHCGCRDPLRVDQPAAVPVTTARTRSRIPSACQMMKLLRRPGLASAMAAKGAVAPIAMSPPTCRQCEQAR